MLKESGAHLMSNANKLATLQHELEQLRKENAHLRAELNNLRNKQQTPAMNTLAQFQDLLRALPVLFFVCDSRGRCLLWNKACHELLGWTEEELKAHPNPLSLLYPDMMDYQAAQMRLEQAERRFYRYLVRSQSGAYRLQKWAYCRLPDGHILGIGYDIAEMDRPTTDIVAADLEETRVQLLQRLIGDITHDLKTPLSIINTKVFLLERESNATRRKIHATAVAEQVRHLTELIDNMVEMVRLDNQTALKLERCNVHTLLLEIDEGLRNMAEAKQVGINLELNADNPYVQADPKELHRAFMNLIRNAINYTTESGSITVRTQSVDGQIIIMVEDTGIGISADDLPHIFTRFYRADAARSSNTGGSGLGLSIVKRIIDMHHGQIEAHSTVGVGTTFTIKLASLRPQDNTTD